MKTKLIEKKEKNEFKPVTIEVTIESLDELKVMYHRLNIQRCSFNSPFYSTEMHGKHEYSSIKYDNFVLADEFELFDLISNILEKLSK